MLGFTVILSLLVSMYNYRLIEREYKWSNGVNHKDTTRIVRLRVVSLTNLIAVVFWIMMLFIIYTELTPEGLLIKI